MTFQLQRSGRYSPDYLELAALTGRTLARRRRLACLESSSGCDRTTTQQCPLSPISQWRVLASLSRSRGTSAYVSAVSRRHTGYLGEPEHLPAASDVTHYWRMHLAQHVFFAPRVRARRKARVWAQSAVVSRGHSSRRAELLTLAFAGCAHDGCFRSFAPCVLAGCRCMPEASGWRVRTWERMVTPRGSGGFEASWSLDRTWGISRRLGESTRSGRFDAVLGRCRRDAIGRACRA